MVSWGYMWRWCNGDSGDGELGTVVMVSWGQW